ncbi:MAG: tetratricopeptide repeat protein [Bacteroidota bacterium]
MNRFLLFSLSVVLLAGCKGGQTVSTTPASKTSQPKTEMSDAQRAEVTYAFFNANKEKILGNLDNAAGLFSEVIRKDPNNAAAMYELANIYSEQKKFADALYFAKGAYQLDKKNSWYILTYTDLLQKNKKFADAASILEKAVADAPAKPDFYYEWASALLYAEKPADAIKVYDKLESQVGVTREVTMQKSRIYQRMNKNEKAIEELDKLIALDPKDSQAYGMKAEIYQAMGKKDLALETYNKILSIDPDNPYVHLSLADFYRNGGEKEKSVEELKKAFLNKELDIDTKISILSSYYSLIEIHPELKPQALEMCQLLVQANANEPRAHAVYGDFLIRDKKWEEAKVEYSKAKELGAKDFLVYNQLMFIYVQLADWKLLQTESAEAMSLFPEQPITYYFNGFASMQNKKYNDAISTLNTGIKLVVDDKRLETNFLSSLGEAYNEIRDFVKSDESFEKALVLDPKDANVMNNYAYFLSERNEKLDRAEQLSKVSNELEPNQSSYEDTYGWIMYKQGKYSDAKIWIEKSLANGSDKSATVLEHYGDVVYHLGDNAKALEYWQKAKAAGEGASDFLERKILEKRIFE